MRLNAKQIALYTGGEFQAEPLDASSILTGITWDSREVQPDWLFVALPGEKVDGHSYVEAAIRAGAKAVLISEPLQPPCALLAKELGVAVIGVSNTYHAIADLAANWRKHLKATVIGITGSTGKTTTKNLVRDVAAAKFSVCATKANQNNELGVPRTLLSADPETEVVVVEMGMRGPGQITDLCNIAKPDWGVITNVGESHMELLGSQAAIARAKRELFDALPSGTGKAFVYAADPFAEQLVALSELAERKVEVVCFGGEDTGGEGCGDGPACEGGEGVEAAACVWAEDAHLDDEGRAAFALCAKGFLKLSENAAAPTLFNMQPDVEKAQCRLALSGMHNVINATAAAAVGRALDIPLNDIAVALGASVPEVGRQEMLTAREGFKVLNDAYNANPDSMRASLAAFSAMKLTGKRYAVLGDMGELGSISRQCHQGIGRAVAQLPIDMLICVGDMSYHIAEGAREAGMPEERIAHANSVADVLLLLEGRLAADDAVLVKASHFMELNRVVEGLLS